MRRSRKPQCYLVGCERLVDSGYFHSLRCAAEFGELMAQGKGRSWCGAEGCRAWVLLPEAFHNLLRHGRLEVS